VSAAAEPDAPARAAPDPVWTRRIRVTQIGLCLVVGFAAVVELIRMVQLGAPVGGYAALVLAVAGCVAAFRRPVAGLVLVAVAPMTAALLGWDPLVPWNIAVFTALILTARGLPGTLTAVTVGVANLAAVSLSSGTIGLTGATARVPIAETAAISAFAAVAAAAIGSSMLGQLHYVSELHQRTHDAVAARRSAVDRGVAQERVRIARDLHDGLGHRVAVLSMRLGAAEVHLPSGAAESRDDLAAARADLQAVLAETQQILQVLRRDDDRDGAGDLDAPLPEHARIPQLISAFRAAGLDVDARLGELSRPLAAQTGTATYRIAQEMLTNAQKHGTGTVSLHIHEDGEAIVIDAVNVRSTQRSRPPGSGFGLIGLRERAVAVGGRLDVLADTDLFRVRAVLPLGGDSG
jgi:signal transduction histidine kinase